MIIIIIIKSKKKNDYQNDYYSSDDKYSYDSNIKIIYIEDFESNEEMKIS